MQPLTLCTNTDCPIKSDCLRAQAWPEGEKQSMGFFHPVYLPDGAVCAHKKPMTETKEK